MCTHTRWVAVPGCAVPSRAAGSSSTDRASSTSVVSAESIVITWLCCGYADICGGSVRTRTPPRSEEWSEVCHIKTTRSPNPPPQHIRQPAYPRISVAPSGSSGPPGSPRPGPGLGLRRAAPRRPRARAGSGRGASPGGGWVGRGRAGCVRGRRSGLITRTAAAAAREPGDHLTKRLNSSAKGYVQEAKSPSAATPPPPLPRPLRIPARYRRAPFEAGGSRGRSSGRCR